jgi:hypothetical protein
LRPKKSIGIGAGLSTADVMHLIEKRNEGVRNGDGALDVVPSRRRAFQNNGPRRAIDLRRRQGQPFR